MTGFGSARLEDADLQVSVEIRSVNNRYLKISTKCIEPYGVFEPEIERLIRARVNRGTVQIVLRIHRELSAEDFRLSRTAIQSYIDQLRLVHKRVNVAAVLGQVLALPGVVEDGNSTGSDPMELWPRVGPIVEAAAERLNKMRADEGAAMRRELREHCDFIGKHVAHVAARAPLVVELFRDRLHERVQTLLAKVNVTIDRSELIKEVAIFAERSDIAEEIARLRSHLDQFAAVIDEPESSGRKLEFLSQEMFREANTIGSKASDVEISKHTVEMKGAIERIREMIQNVE
jgi:uncharacterized protein (TIGR00255 family)